MAASGFSAALLAQLKLEEDAVAALKSRRAAAGRSTRAKVLPHPAVIQSYVDRLLKALDHDRVLARRLLLRHMPPLVLKPEGRTYRATGGFDFYLCFEEAEGGAKSQAGPNGAPARSVAGSVAADESALSAVGGTGIEPATRAV